MMHRELVERDAWASEDRFRKTFALYQALPGPEATELAVWFGHLQRGRAGGLVAGLGFILPGVLLVSAAAFLYATVLPERAQWDPLLYGARPAVLGLMLAGAVRLARVNVTTPTLLGIMLVAAVVDFAVGGASFLLVLAGAGVAALAVASGLGAVRRARSDHGGVPVGACGLLLLAAAPLFAAPAFLWVFAQCGLLTFGGAYTIIPVLEHGAVGAGGWISHDQLLDAMAITGVLPTPFVSVGSFVGYQAAGVGGLLVATVLIFLPAFAFTLLGHRLFERVVQRPGLHRFLVGVTAGVVGVLASSLVPLLQAAGDRPQTLALVAGSFVAFHFFPRVPPVAVIGAAVAMGATIAWT